MSDNLSRLRGLAVALDNRVPLAGMISADASTCRYAADELEQLRAEVAALKLTIENLRAFALFIRANMVDTLRVQDKLYAALEAGREMPARDEPSATPRTLA